MTPIVGRFTGVVRKPYGYPVPVVVAYRPGWRWTLKPAPELIGERRRPDPWWAWGDDAIDADGRLAVPAVHLAAVILREVTEDFASARFAEEFVADHLLHLPRTGWILDMAKLAEWVEEETAEETRTRELVA